MRSIVVKLHRGHGRIDGEHGTPNRRDELQGFGRFGDWTTFGNRATTAAVFDGFPATRIVRDAGKSWAFKVFMKSPTGRDCVATLWIDGNRAAGLR
jgi:hypothetical protein